MNKFIKTDIENAVIQMKAAIMNALHDIDSFEDTYIDLGENISANLLFRCLKEAEWKEDESSFNINGLKVDFESYWYAPSGNRVSISGSLRHNTHFVIKICNIYE